MGNPFDLFNPRKFEKKLENTIGNIADGNDAKSFFKNIGRKINGKLKELEDRIKYFFNGKIFIIVISVIIVLSLVLELVGFFVLDKYFDENAIQCIDEFDLETDYGTKIVKALPEDYLINQGYKYEATTQKSTPTNFGITSNYDLKKINISGVWIPWFGDEIIDDTNKSYIDHDTPNENFICQMQKVDLWNNNKYYYGNTKEENEFYYIKNYYSDVDVKSIDNVEYSILPANYQYQCWLNRGMGLYMGYYGRDGKQQPEHFHHILAKKAICENAYFIPEALYTTFQAKINDSHTLVKFDGGYYDVRDFKKEYFSLSYYIEREIKYYDSIGDSNNKSKFEGYLSTAREYDKQILTNSELYTEYDIDLHEKLLYQYGVRNPALIIANSTSKFNQACYFDKKIIEVDESGEENIVTKRTYVGKFRFEETKENPLYKKYASNNDGVNVKYDYGEVIKFLILDRYYSDNQGGYKLEFLSGFNVNEDTGTIEKFLTKFEKFMIGTSIKESDKDRTDGLMIRIYSSIINSNIKLLARAILSLFIIINGFFFILGYKKFETKEFMMFCLKMAVLFAFLNDKSYAFINKTFINFFINGASGAIELLYDIFSNIFIEYDVTSNNIFNYSFGNSSNYLSKYFRFLDNVFQFLFAKEVHLKILSLVFEFPIFGFIAIMFIYSLMFSYTLTLLGTAIPFLKILFQLAILIGLTPLFLLFMFFKKTTGFFKSWLNYIVSRSFEMIIFFFTLFAISGIINNRFIRLLGYTICKENILNVFKNRIGIKNNLIIGLLNTIFGENSFVATINDEISFKTLIVNLCTLGCWILLFKHIVSFISNILSSMINFDGSGMSGNTNKGGFFSDNVGTQFAKATNFRQNFKTLREGFKGLNAFDIKIKGKSLRDIGNTIDKYTGISKFTIFNGKGEVSAGTTFKNIASSTIKTPFTEGIKKLYSMKYKEGDNYINYIRKKRNEKMEIRSEKIGIFSKDMINKVENGDEDAKIIALRQLTIASKNGWLFDENGKEIKEKDLAKYINKHPEITNINYDGGYKKPYNIIIDEDHKERIKNIEKLDNMLRDKDDNETEEEYEIRRIEAFKIMVNEGIIDISDYNIDPKIAKKILNKETGRSIDNAIREAIKDKDMYDIYTNRLKSLKNVDMYKKKNNESKILDNKTVEKVYKYYENRRYNKEYLNNKFRNDNEELKNIQKNLYKGLFDNLKEKNKNIDSINVKSVYNGYVTLDIKGKDNDNNEFNYEDKAFYVFNDDDKIVNGAFAISIDKENDRYVIINDTGEIIEMTKEELEDFRGIDADNFDKEMEKIENRYYDDDDESNYPKIDNIIGSLTDNNLGLTFRSLSEISDTGSDISEIAAGIEKDMNDGEKGLVELNNKENTKIIEDLEKKKNKINKQIEANNELLKQEDIDKEKIEKENETLEKINKIYDSKKKYACVKMKQNNN